MTNLSRYNKFFAVLIPMLILAWNNYRPDGAPEVTDDQIDAVVNAVIIFATPFLVWLVPNARP